MRKLIILFGGQSYEHEISIVSAISLHKAIAAQCAFVFLSPDRRFYLIDLIDMKAEYFANGRYRKSVELFLARGGFERKTLFGRTPIDGDVVVSVAHGADGEDGKLAALFEFYGVNYVGPRLEASALSFNKLFTKFLAAAAGVKTLPYQTIRRGDTITIAYPFIVKPLRLGSSIGVSVAKDESDLSYAIDMAFEFDDEAIVEPFIADVLEYNLAGCKTADGWRLSAIEQPQKKELLDFEQKYLDFARDGKVKEAALPSETAEALREAFRKIYSQGFDGALIRCDFFVLDGEVVLNEINPIPGSLANYLFDDYETTLNALIDSLPRSREIAVTYNYIRSIRSAKGKL
ncbi:MAG: D-alanine--D-alanine ligase [Helicobacteraceae bacterium]|jgi:D-alanine-D-alanine ligase|nr:D-alanine--D-alanine ligase [Helicobacteraceae bacterium]